MGDVRVTSYQAFLVLLIGAGLIVSGLVWLLGPWALISFGLILVALALLIPERSDDAQPVDEAVPPL